MEFHRARILDKSSQIALFKKGLNCFFMDIITDILFIDTHDLPDDQVIESLIEILMPCTRTAEPALLDLNLNKTIKSTLFQLLLACSTAQVHGHLNKILSRSESFLSHNYASDDLADLKLMFINAIENSFYAKEAFAEADCKLDMDVKLGTSFLQQELEDSTGAPGKLDSLKTVAKIRFIIGTFARLFGEWPRLEKHADKQDYVDFIELTEMFIRRCQCQWPRFYLIKCVFRTYGQSVLVESVESDLFDWIVPREIMLESEADLQDSYVVCGPGYLKVRDTLRDGLVLGKFGKLPVQNKQVFFFLISMFSEIRTLSLFLPGFYTIASF